jgi:LysM repeat protein
MSRLLAALLPITLVAAAPLPHASGAPAGPGRGCGGSFTAARGDTLYSIARRCETSVAELVQENRLGRASRLETGQRLAIPGFAQAEAPKPPEAAPPPPAPPPPPPREAANVYHFQAGDTLYSLARWARTSLPALRAANPGIDARDIDVGDPISLPRGAARPEPMRLRERGRPVAVAAPLPPIPPAARPPLPPDLRPAPPPGDEDEADKPKPDDADEDADDATPGGMDDGDPEPDGM